MKLDNGLSRGNGVSYAAQRAREITSFIALGAAIVGSVLWGQACFNRAVVRANTEATHHEGEVTQAAIYAESKARQIGDSTMLAGQAALADDLESLGRRVDANTEISRQDRMQLHRQVDSVLSIFRPIVRPQPRRR